MDMRGVADRRGVAGTMPCGADAKEFAERGDLASRADAADLREVATNEINQAAANEIEPFIWIVEQLTHGDGCGALLAQHFEIANVFRREGIFEEEKPIWLQLFGEPDRIDGRETFVHVVKQLDFVAELFAQILEQFWDGTAVNGGLEEFPGEMPFASELHGNCVGGCTKPSAI